MIRPNSVRDPSLSHPIPYRDIVAYVPVHVVSVACPDTKPFPPLAWLGSIEGTGM